MKLAGFGGDEIRPTADRVKESLFNIIGARVPSSRVCDLFCGSGNLGIECLSRGAAEAYFNDVSQESLAVLGKNLVRLSGGEKYFVSRGDYLAFLKCARVAFDIIFIDPPYRFDYGVPALETVSARGLLGKDGFAVYERDRAFAGEIKGMEMYDERKYGKTYLSFFRRARAGSLCES